MVSLIFVGITVVIMNWQSNVGFASKSCAKFIKRLTQEICSGKFVHFIRKYQIKNLTFVFTMVSGYENNLV